MGDMATILPNHEDTQIDTHTNDSNDANRILSPCNLPVGEYVTPQNWNALLLDPQVAVIDTRNDYEINIGSFQNAINPHTSSFKFFPAWLQQFSKEFPYTKYPDEQYDEIHTKYNNENSKEPPHPRKLKAVAMFCTGGVRCEKSTAYALASNLFQNLSTKSTTTIHSAATSTTTNPTDLSSSIPIYHLAGGILAYLQQIPQEQSLFHGECFVFDQRVSVHGNDLQPGVHTSCHACRKPLTPLDLQHKDYVKGVMCHYCANDIRMNERKVKRMQERQKQMEIAEARGAVHIHDPKNVE